MAEKSQFRHWSWTLDSEDVAHLTLDRAERTVNSLSQEVLGEFEDVLEQIRQQRPQALVIRSAKKYSFIVGADVSEFKGWNDSSDILAYILKVQNIFSNLEHLQIPTLAVIDGPCLGGGLELALACQYRIAVDDPATRLGLPEVNLGIHPGFGGTVRSIRLIGTVPALQMMLTGRGFSARQARRIGLVDAAVPRRVVENAVSVLLQQRPEKKPLGFVTRLGGVRLIRSLLARYLKKQVSQRVDPAHYPAPYALLDLWRQHADDPEQMFLEEARSVTHLITGDTAQNLVRVFFLQTFLKGGTTQAQPIERLHVIGAGSMGRDIASWCALQGIRVTLQDVNHDALAEAVKTADKLFRKKLKQPWRVSAAHDRLMADPDGHGIAGADLVIEAIVEKLEVKRKLFEDVETLMRPDAILASNTSSIPLEELAEGLKRPGQFLGIHFFNPVPKMPLVEVVQAKSSDSHVLERATGFVRQIKHLPLPVKSAPGFLVNRILMPYLLAAVELVEEGYSPQEVDQAALDFGMPMGPLHLADQVGIDICLSVADVFSGYFDRSVPTILRQMVDEDKLGLKSGQGFYRYRRGKKERLRQWKGKKTNSSLLLGRLLEPLLTEAEACLEEKIVESADLVDAGMVFGTGFAPFTGGPLHYKYRSREL